MTRQKVQKTHFGQKTQNTKRQSAQNLTKWWLISGKICLFFSDELLSFSILIFNPNFDIQEGVCYG